MNDDVKRVFTPKPMVLFRSSRKISSYLVRAKLYPIERTVGSLKCGSKRCEVCKYITETDTFTSSVTGETYKINHRLDCNDKCLVYSLTCNKCKKQCTGQTTDNFRGRWNNYKSKSKSFKRGEKCMQEHLYKHFESEEHTEFLDISIILIDKTDGSNPTKRERKITGCEPLKHLHLTALMLKIVSSLGRGCRARRDLSLVGHLHDLDFYKYLGHAISTRFDYS